MTAYVASMSLTSEIKAKRSVLSVFLEEELPGLANVRTAYRSVRPNRPTVRPTPPDGTRVQYGTIGAALDHRLRFAFSDTLQENSAVAAGIRIAANPQLGFPLPVAKALSHAGSELLSELRKIVAEVKPHDRSRPILLPDTAEDYLSRLCYVAAWFEELFRTGRAWPGTPLGNADGTITLSSLLAAVPAYAVDDLRSQAALADRALEGIRSQTKTDAVILGPTFTGSNDVGGADADMIIGTLLVDVKSTVKAESLAREEIYQLIGYTLLDYENRYGIEEVGLYLSRLGWLATWPLDTFLSLLGAKKTLPELRKLCAATL
jgi:hypothetical protein